MKYKVYSFKEFSRLLKDNGYALLRTNGDHYIYGNNSGDKITINCNLNPMVARRLIKEHNLFNY